MDSNALQFKSLRREMPLTRSQSPNVPVEHVLANNDLLRCILERLSILDLARTSAVCQSWNKMSNCDEFWTRLDLNSVGRQVPVHQVIMLCERHKDIQHLALSGECTNLSSVQMFTGALSHLSNLRKLELSYGVMDDSILSCFVTRLLPELRYMGFHRIQIGDELHPAEFRIKHQDITTLVLTRCSIGRLCVRSRNLIDLVLEQTEVSHLQLSLPCLQSLNISHCTKGTDFNLRHTLTGLTALTRLSLIKCTSLSDDTTRELSEHLSLLKHLNLSSCSAISLNGVRGGFTNLTVLVLNHCEALAGSGVQTALESLPSLEEVYMDACPLLNQICINLPRLRVLSMRNCQSLASLEVTCSQLTDLILGSPQGLGQVECVILSSLYIFSTQLKQIHWRHFPSLETLRLDCPNLDELCLGDCDNLRDSVFQMLSDSVPAPLGKERAPKRLGIGCPKLQTLRLEGCEGLRRSELWHKSLTSLNLSGCKGISSLQLGCPMLEELKLDDCCEMQEALLRQSRVRKLFLGACCSLVRVNVSSEALCSLDLRGCGGLEQLTLDCPSLSDIDATFCLKLTESGLAAAMASQPPVERLVLSVCSQISIFGYSLLPSTMRSLDLSYTHVSDLSSLYDSCPQLTALNLSSCRELDTASLLRILPSRGFKLPQLVDLDISYCQLPTASVASILLEGTNLVSLAINGCEGVVSSQLEALNSCGTLNTNGCEGVVSSQLEALNGCGTPNTYGEDVVMGGVEVVSGVGEQHSTCIAPLEMAPPPGAGAEGSAAGGAAEGVGMEGVEGACTGQAPPSRPHSLRSLSLVKCQGLNSVFLGLQPEPYEPPCETMDCQGVEHTCQGVKVYTAKHYPFLSRRAIECESVNMRWREVPTLVSGLRTLRLGLSGVQAVALALPELAQLELSGCTYLRMLELRCPLLLTLLMQACRMVPRQVISRAVGEGCPRLETLDVQHVQMTAASSLEGAAVGPSTSTAEKRALCEGSEIRNLLVCSEHCKVCSSGH